MLNNPKAMHPPISIEENHKKSMDNKTRVSNLLYSLGYVSISIL
jgi:hypothetical protein